MISTKYLKDLPPPKQVLRICQSVAMLDAIVSPDWENRYYSFDSKWGPQEMLASMRNGQGDHYFILFSEYGVLLKGFMHESAMSPFIKNSGIWPGVIDSVPNEFRPFLEDPSFLKEETTFCIWRRNFESSWNTGKIDFPEGSDPDGSERLLFILDGKHETYWKWAEEYYQRILPVSAIRLIYQHKPLSDDLIKELNPEKTLQDLSEDIDEISYLS